MAGVLVGAVTVGLTVLARKTPPDRWAPTLSRVAKDAVAVIRARYGNSEPLDLVEKALEQYGSGESPETALSSAFHEAAEKAEGTA